MSASVLYPPSMVPPLRVRSLNAQQVRPERDYVLYWMTAFRRLHSNFALQRAADWSARLARPLLVFEPLRVDYPWASDRFHRFVLDGMADNRRECERARVACYPYVESVPGQGKGLLSELASRACVVVGDDFPEFFLPAAARAAARQTDVLLEIVDSNGLHALRAMGREFKSAHSFRRWFQANLDHALAHFPVPNSLAGVHPGLAELPDTITSRWPLADQALLDGDADLLAALPVDHRVPVVTARGGSTAARERLAAFVEGGLRRYAEDRNHPDRDASSRLSPYLHFGHISVHEVFTAVADAEGWSAGRLHGPPDGRRSGFWGMSEGAEAFVDQVATWRELGFNFCAYRADYDRYGSLPEWAQRTLARHARDPRPHLYSLEQLDAAATADDLWNAAQTQLVREGRMHNYLRMLWGKRILEWTASPRDALDVMVHLNNKYALDGRDPNSYSGIFWVLGRFDRPWGPERPIFGTVRYMSSGNTAKKLKVADYVRRYTPDPHAASTRQRDAGG